MQSAAQALSCRLQMGITAVKEKERSLVARSALVEQTLAHLQDQLLSSDFKVASNNPNPVSHFCFF
jgi:hypothetical protein